MTDEGVLEGVVVWIRAAQDPGGALDAGRCADIGARNPNPGVVECA